MFKPDIIVTWPNSTDFPLWRQHVRDNRERYGQIIVVFHETNHGTDYKEFVKSAMTPDDILFLDPPPLPAGEDWRNHCVNFGLEHSTNEWIYFTEQDFFPYPAFWEEIASAEKEGCEVIASADGTRMHPCCIFIKRSLLDKTHKDFSARPAEGYDHFGRLQADLINTGALVHTIEPINYKHYNGLSQNFRLMSDGERPNYHEDDFIRYLTMCVQTSVPLDARFMNVVANYLRKIEPEQGMAL